MVKANSSYEEIRQRNIARNNERLEELKLKNLGQELHKASPKPTQVDSLALCTENDGGHFSSQEEKYPTSDENCEGKVVENRTRNELLPLSEDRPYHHVILSKTQVEEKIQMRLPDKITCKLPEAVVPVVLTYRKKNWNMKYIGDCSGHKRFDSGWKNFVRENKVKVGDGCVFELTDCSADCVKFSVQILDGELPEELLRRVDGLTSDTPILLLD